MKLNIKINLLVALLVFVTSTKCFSQTNQKFKVTLDAGHGAHDPGAKYHGYTEKNITLAIVLKVGEILERISNIDVIYTRKTDVFIELRERAKIANKANTDLFISVHCNANKNLNACGSETYVMGMSRSNMNFEVSKAENSVIFLEDNYKQVYKGFDPKNPETLIGLKLIQENNLTNSISLATKIEDNFIGKGIKSRGVKQEPLWVLDATIMPGVLIETGFVSNAAEGAKLDSSEGQQDIAQAIADAIISYKNDFLSGNVEEDYPIKNNSDDKDKSEETEEGVVYKVQLCSSPKKVELKSKNFKGLKNITSISENKMYKYIYGEASSIKEAKKLLQESKSKGYDTAFLIAFKDGKSISMQDAIK